jgi:hypothetical protein
VVSAISMAGLALLIAVCSVFFTCLKKKEYQDGFMDVFWSKRDAKKAPKVSKKRIGISIGVLCYFFLFLIPKMEPTIVGNSRIPYVKQAFLKNTPFRFEDL